MADSVGSETEEPDLSADQRAQALKAIAYLRARFGELWLRQVFDQAHPFMDLVWNRAPWTRVRIADLVDAIQQVEGLPGGKRLIDRYTRADQQSGALFELDLAATALRKHLTVELEPQTQPGRACDMAIAELQAPGPHTVFVEVQSIQDLGDETKRAMEVVERLAPTLAWVMSGRELLGGIYRIPNEAELVDLLPVTDAFWRRCESSSEPEHLQIDEVIDVWSVPVGHAAKAALLAAGFPNKFSSPAPDDPLRRTLRAVRQKLGQLPTLAPGLIVLRPPRLLFLNPKSLPQVVAAVKHAIAGTPQVSAVALVEWAYRSTATPAEARVALAGALVIHHLDRHIFVREVVLIENASRAYRSGDQVIHRLL